MALETPDNSITFPNTAPSKNTGKYSFRKPTILSMNAEHRCHQLRIGQQYRAQRRYRREQDHAVAAVGHHLIRKHSVANTIKNDMRHLQRTLGCECRCQSGDATLS